MQVFIKQTFSVNFKLVIINKEEGETNFKKQTFPSLREIPRGRDIVRACLKHEMAKRRNG